VLARTGQLAAQSNAIGLNEIHPCAPRFLVFVERPYHGRGQQLQTDDRTRQGSGGIRRPPPMVRFNRD
jgi:hypothetical protein